MALIKFWGPCEIAKGKEDACDYAKNNHPKSLEDGMPEVPEIETAPGSWEVLLDRRRHGFNCAGRITHRFES